MYHGAVCGVSGAHAGMAGQAGGMQRNVALSPHCTTTGLRATMQGGAGILSWRWRRASASAVLSQQAYVAPQITERAACFGTREMARGAAVRATSSETLSPAGCCTSSVHSLTCAEPARCRFTAAKSPLDAARSNTPAQLLATCGGSSPVVLGVDSLRVRMHVSIAQ
jgi:hypothetical protein